MIEYIITIIVTFALPLPIWMILLHLGMGSKTSRLVQTILYFSLGVVWLLIGYYLFSRPDILFGNVFTTTPWTQAIGGMLILIGLTIDYFVIKVLGWRRITFFTEFKKEAAPDQLVVSGIYRYARHPRYVEYPLIAIGFALLLGYQNLFWYAGYIFLGLWINTYFEEQELIKRFGAKYVEYKKRVPKFFFTFRS